MKQETLAAKQTIINQIGTDIKEASSVTVVEYRGLTVKEVEELRKSLRNEGAEMKVFKNTFVDRAVDDLGYADLKKDLVGPNAFIFSHEDEVAGPRIASKFAKRHPKLVVKSGILDGKFISTEEMKTIATLPGRNGLISMLLSCLQSPVRSFACALQAVADKQGQNA